MSLMRKCRRVYCYYYFFLHCHFIYDHTYKKNVCEQEMYVSGQETCSNETFTCVDMGCFMQCLYSTECMHEIDLLINLCTLFYDFCTILKLLPFIMSNRYKYSETTSYKKAPIELLKVFLIKEWFYWTYINLLYAG